ncbi:MAG TPA: gliding motility-associated C-terminal domain-containing protein [Saprospiraceae bacterium]|nr:gliding motility-associated C-terminal domain-containing protein [Saprospiraceae bacterium]HPG07465.1 gliding motility-associated C-terminal domain-containing protein [Saprospiraceae bacterium]HRV84973.1 gliding motility-associated C-terminal domain-containing protein [Saprospiraceae bacterium]
MNKWQYQILLTITVVAFMATGKGYGQIEPFVCSGEYYLTLRPGFISNMNQVIIDPVTEEVRFKPIPGFPPKYHINGMGYRSTDNFIYTLEQDTRTLIRIGKNGTAQELRVIQELFNGQYPAGDVTPDGHYLILIGGSPFSVYSNFVAFVDLTSPSYPVTVHNVNFTASIYDFAFDPFTGVAYGYDSQNQRVITINFKTFEIQSVSRTRQIASSIASVFFDAFGNLYGYGSIGQTFGIQNTLFKIDKDQGIVEFLTRGEEANRSDACSCPFTLKLQKTVAPRETVPCSMVEYTFIVANSTGFTQSGIRLEDQLPQNFSINKILTNPFGGDVLSAEGPDRLIIENMVVPPGIDSVKIEVYVGPNTVGHRGNQALLSRLAVNLGTQTLSDDPATLKPEDSTFLNVVPFVLDLENQNKQLCPGETLVLMGNQNGVSYLWNDASTGSSYSVSEPGTYWVKAETGCATLYDTIEVVFSPPISVDLGEDLVVDLGEEARVFPDVNSSIDFVNEWTATTQKPFPLCRTCSDVTVRPLFDATLRLTVTNTAGCTASDSLEIRVNKVKDILAPNAFSPNGDGNNDVFYLFGKGVDRVEAFRIFDRWGNIVYERKDLTINEVSQGWDGRVKDGSWAQPGVYVWTAQVRFLDDDIRIAGGDITLIR